MESRGNIVLAAILDKSNEELLELSSNLRRQGRMLLEELGEDMNSFLA